MDERNKYTVEDALARQVLETSQSISTQPLIVVGGMAVQLLNPAPSLNRPTDDVDILPVNKVSTQEFREEIAPYFLEQAPADMGVNASKGHRSYEIEYSAEGERPFFTHICYFSKNYWARHEEWKGREIENAEYKDFGLGSDILVFRPEDILANKLRRLRNLYTKGFIDDENQKYFAALRHGDVDSLASVDLESRLETVKDARWAIIQDLGEKKYAANEKVEPYKVMKDIYDVGLLSRALSSGEQDFSPAYYREATKNLRSLPS